MNILLQTESEATDFLKWNSYLMFDLTYAQSRAFYKHSPWNRKGLKNKKGVVSSTVVVLIAKMLCSLGNGKIESNPRHSLRVMTIFGMYLWWYYVLVCKRRRQQLLQIIAL